MTKRSNRLTPRQKQMCCLLIEGHTTSKELAEAMGKTPQAVKNMMCELFDFTGMSNRVELALYLERNRALFEEPLSPGC